MNSKGSLDSCEQTETTRLQAELEAALHERNIWEEAAGLLYDIANASMTMDFYYDNAKRHLEARVLPTDEVLE